MKAKTLTSPACGRLIRTFNLRTCEDGSKDHGNCEKYHFSFSFSVLDHWWRTGKGKRFGLEGKQRLLYFAVWRSSCHRTPKWAFRGVLVKTMMSQRSARYIPTCNFCFHYLRLLFKKRVIREVQFHNHTLLS